MLEIIVIATVVMKIAGQADGRGHSKLMWGIVALLSWLGGEAVGIVIGRSIDLPGIVAYALALAVGAACLTLVYRHVKALPDRFTEA